MTRQAELNDLIREAFGAQEALDNWDEGRTIYGFGSFVGVRYCSLEEAVRDLDEANLKLVAFCVKYGQELTTELASGGS